MKSQPPHTRIQELDLLSKIIPLVFSQPETGGPTLVGFVHGNMIITDPTLDETGQWHVRPEERYQIPVPTADAIILINHCLAFAHEQC